MDEAPRQELTQAVLAELWKASREKRVPDDENLAAFQKFMILHEDMHDFWDKLVENPAMSLDVEGGNLLVHIAMDAATEKALMQDEPAGLRAVFSDLMTKGFDESRAFHVISQAMEHEFMTAASQSQAMGLDAFLTRAREYSKQALAQGQGPQP